MRSIYGVKQKREKFILTPLPMVAQMWTFFPVQVKIEKLKSTLKLFTILKKYIKTKQNSWMCPLSFYYFFFVFIIFFNFSARVTPPARTSELASRRGSSSNTYRRRSFHCDVDGICHGNPTDGGGASSSIESVFLFFLLHSLTCNTHTKHTSFTLDRHVYWD